MPLSSVVPMLQITSNSDLEENLAMGLEGLNQRETCGLPLGVKTRLLLGTEKRTCNSVISLS